MNKRTKLIAEFLNMSVGLDFQSALDKTTLLETKLDALAREEKQNPVTIELLDVDFDNVTEAD
jgi:hypothetical protein